MGWLGKWFGEEETTVRGPVRGFEETNEPFGQGTRLLWRFRVEPYGPDNRPVKDAPPVTIEMRGHRFHGDIDDGDTVRVEGELEDGVIKPKRVYNETTKSWVHRKLAIFG